MEDRVTPATITWTNPAGGVWGTAGNWDLNRVPAAGDDVVIPDIGAAGVNQTITVNNLTANTVQSIACAENLTLAGGSLTLAGGTQAVSVAGTLLLNPSSTLAGATLATGTTLTSTNTGPYPILDGATINSGAKVRLDGASLEVRNGLTVNGAVELNNSALYVTGVQAIGGAGKIDSVGTDYSDVNTDTTLTLGPNLTVTGKALRFVSRGLFFTTSLVNQGLIEVVNPTLTQILTTSFTNDPGGRLAVGNAGGILDIRLTVNTSNPTATMWSNQGTVTLTAGTLNLGGKFTTAGIGTLTRTGGTAGTVNITGAMDNTGATLALAGPGGRGPVALAGGGITGGTVTGDANNVLLTASGTASTLDGVTLAAGAVLRFPGDATVTTVNGLTVNGRVEFNTPTGAFLDAKGTQTYGGSGVIEFASTGDPSSSTSGLRLAAANSTLTLGPGLTVRGGLGAFKPIPNTGSVTNVGLINQGLIEGTSAAAAAELSVSLNTFTNTGTVRVAGAKQAFNLNTPNGSWTNAGVFELSAGTLILDGATTTAGIGVVNRTGGTVELRATIDNTGATLKLAGAGGLGPVVTSSDATILGGTIAGDATNTVTVTGTSTTFDGVTVNADLAFGNLANLVVVNDLTANATVNLGASGGLVFKSAVAAANQRLQTTTGAAVTVQGTSGPRAAFQQSGTSHTVTIGAGVVVSGKGFSDFIGSATGTGGTWVNEGTIAAKSGGSLALAANNTFVNGATGRWVAEAGGTFGTGGNWTNDGLIEVAGGTLNLGGNFTAPAINTPGRFTRTGGTVNLTGTLTGNWAMIDTVGDVFFRGGTLKNGTFSVTPGHTARLIATTTYSTLDGMTLANPIDMTSTPASQGAASVQVNNGLTLNTILPIGDNTGPFGNYGILNFSGNQTLGGTGTIVFGTRAGAGAGTLSQQTSSDILTIGPNILIRGTSGTVGGGGWVINQGTIRRDSGAETFNITLGNGGRNEGLIDTTVTSTVAGSRTYITANSNNTWTNHGTITSSGVLLVGLQATEGWTNYGTIASTGGIVEFAGVFTQAKLGTFTRAPATVVRLGSNARFNGDLTLDDATGDWVLSGGTLDAGTLRTSGAARLIGGSGGGTLKNYAVNGILDLTQASSTIDIDGGLALNTTLNVGDAAGSFGTQLRIRNDQTWTGTGMIVFGGGANSIASGNGSYALTIDSGVILRGKGVTFTSGLTGVTNRGTIAVDVAGAILVFNALSFTNLGTVKAANGSEWRLLITPSINAGFTNFTNVTQTGSVYSGTLAGGRWEIGAGSTIRVYNTTFLNAVHQFTRLNADVILDGGGSNFYGGSSTPYDALNSLSELGGDGSLTLRNGRTLVGHSAYNAATSTETPFTTAGDITIGPGSALRVSPTLVSRWSGEGDANDAAGRNNGTASANLTYATGDVGQAFVFNDTTDVVAISDSALLRTTAITVSTRIKPTSISQFGSGLIVGMRCSIG